MDRRHFVKADMAAAGITQLTDATSSPSTGAATAVPAILDAGVHEQQAQMQAGRLTATSLVRQYLARIAAVDRAGPRLNAVIELNPDALAIAAALDRERRSGKVRGPLHGIPVLVKDNIATHDKMSTTAGSLALDGVRAGRDAFVVRKLRAAGAVILGKTNLSEWANMRSPHSTSGWSARGGQTRNPYALDRNPGGSSSGSAAAVAAGLATLAVGTETDGSIVAPSAICGVVGIKPTLGLVSRSGIIPIARSQDTAGPMARTVADAALLLAALAGADPEDEATMDAMNGTTDDAQGRIGDYAAALRTDALRGKRIGVARDFFGGSPAVDALVDKALGVLEEQGAVLVDVRIPGADRYGESELVVLLSEFGPGLEAYLRHYAPHASVKTLADVIAFNDAHATAEMPYFGQEYLLAARDRPGLDDAAYRAALADCRRHARDEGIDRIMREARLDALVAPTDETAWPIDHAAGDPGGLSFTSPAAVAGYPHVTVPAGYVRGLPVGLSFVGRAWSEADLIGMAYAYEQASRRRRLPAFPASAGA